MLPGELTAHAQHSLLAELSRKVAVLQKSDHRMRDIFLVDRIDEQTGRFVFDGIDDPARAPANDRLAASICLEVDETKALDIELIQPGATRHHEDVADREALGQDLCFDAAGEYHAPSNAQRLCEPFKVRLERAVADDEVRHIRDGPKNGREGLEHSVMPLPLDQIAYC